MTFINTITHIDGAIETRYTRRFGMRTISQTDGARDRAHWALCDFYTAHPDKIPAEAVCMRPNCSNEVEIIQSRSRVSADNAAMHIAAIAGHDGSADALSKLMKFQELAGEA